jgi:glycosyltransferase involved in cell wall biosynthesis
LRPHPNLTILSLPTLRLPHLSVAAYVHPRLAAWNWSYGLAAVVATLLLPVSRRPRFILARDPRLARLFLEARALTGAEVLYEVHELFSSRAREPVEQGGPWPPTRTPRVRQLEEAVFREAVGLITLTHASRRLLVDEYRLPAERVTVAPDAVAGVPAELPPRSPHSNTIVYAGQLYPWKGVSTLVSALAELPGAHLKIIGGLSSEDQHTRALRQMAHDLAVLERTEFTGFVPHARVAEAMAGAAAAVVPLPDNPMARYFTSPLKLYEYMAAGLPIVASDLPALREVLEHERNALLVPPEDSAALASALRRLLAEPKLADRIRARAHADVLGRTWAARAVTILGALGHQP